MKTTQTQIQILSILIGLCILCLASISLGSNGSVLRTQGLINPGGNPSAGYLLINEMRISIDRTTQIISYDRTPISVADLKPKRWVYMETEKDPGQNMAKAKKIYLLPRYISPDENHKFSFMK